jgi:hypothetical protein
MDDFDWYKLGEFWAFRRMITPTIIRWVFTVGGVLIVIVGLVMAGAWASEGNNPLMRFLLGMVGAIFALAPWRVACESVIVAFSINDRLGEIAAELKKRERSEQQ